jgi:NAD(P)-dependent dehydrogenase (short-subunit alcohol dehydrogenase family)
MRGAREHIMQRYTNKVAVVTGGNSGIGLAAAKMLKAEGAKVVIVGRDSTTLDATAAEFDRMYTEIAERAGKIDFLFANAGIYKAMPLAETTEAFFDEQVNINFKGLFFTVQKALRHLNDGAAIVLTSSVVNGKGWPDASVYSATKAAVRSLARSFSAELLPRGIRVNAISPGATFTPIFGRLGLSDSEMKATADGILNMIPMRRFATPEDIAHGVLYLGSPEAAYVVGAELTIDGGMGQI